VSFRSAEAIRSSTFGAVTAPLPPGAPQASDPARLTTGQVVPRQVVEMPTGGAFTVDLERAPQTLSDLRAARDELIDLKQVAQRLGRVESGSNDEVSRDAATLLGAVADGGEGSLFQALDAGVLRLSTLIQAIDQELRAYQASERSARNGFDEPRS
jgi:hypothetical protein